LPVLSRQLTILILPQAANLTRLSVILVPFLLLIQCVSAQAQRNPQFDCHRFIASRPKPGRTTGHAAPAGSVSATQQPAFFAVCVNQWPAAWYLVRAGKGRPYRTSSSATARQENFTEPLFFAFPCEDEPIAAKIAGTGIAWPSAKIVPRPTSFGNWRCGGKNLRSLRPKHNYRFAFIAGGSLRTNRFDLRVEYVKDGYLLTGKWRSKQLSGEWRREDSSERGTWQATRTSARLPPRQGWSPL